MEGWPGVHSHSYSKHFPHFPDFALATGAPILPTGSWALPAASVQLAFLPVCLLESACGGVTTGGILVARENRRNLESAPRQGLGTSLNQSPSTACKSLEHS